MINNRYQTFLHPCNVCISNNVKEWTGDFIELTSELQALLEIAMTIYTIITYY